MNDGGFGVETTVPFSWASGPVSAGTNRAGLLLLKVANLLDGHEPEPDKGHERLEAKVDLMLHWLGQHLFGDYDELPPTRLRLGADSVEWHEPGASNVPENVILSLVIHSDLPSPLQLPARVSRIDGGAWRALLQFSDEDAADAWNRWLFRLHRRAIQEARMRSDPD
jgi:hypothetical protein